MRLLASILLFALLLLAGCISQQAQTSTIQATAEAAVQQASATPTALQATQAGGATAPVPSLQKTRPVLTGRVLAGSSSPLLDFSKKDYDAALASGKVVFLYFYANWCPICMAEFPMAQDAFDKLETDKIIGFRVNYNDDETDEFEVQLAREFGIAYQHTKVAIKDGKRALKSPETWDKQRYLIELNKLAE